MATPYFKVFRPYTAGAAAKRRNSMPVYTPADRSPMGGSIEDLLRQGKSVRELVRESIDISRTAFELSLLALVSGDESLSRAVLSAERQVRERELLVYMRNSLAVRSMDDALRSVSIFQLEKNLSRIADASADIAMSYLNFKPPLPRYDIVDGEEVIVKLPYRAGHGARLGRLLSETGVIVNVVALKREEKWILEPPLDTVLRDGDVLVAKGSIYAVKRFAERIGAKVPEPPRGGLMQEFYDIARMVSVMFFLSLSALLMNADWLAENVVELEGVMDRFHAELENKIISSELASTAKAALLSAVFALERIADSLNDIVTPVLEDLEPHPILLEIFEETKERISVIEIDETDAGKTIEDLGYHLKGVTVLAVKRGDDWLVMPPISAFRLQAGDILIVKYFEESESFVEEEETREDREEIIEEIWEEEEED